VEALAGRVTCDKRELLPQRERAIPPIHGRSARPPRAIASAVLGVILALSLVATGSPTPWNGGAAVQAGAAMAERGAHAGDEPRERDAAKPQAGGRKPIDRDLPVSGPMLGRPGDPRPRAATLAAPSGFQVSDVLTGLALPTVVEFVPDGRIFVAEKAGRIYVYDSLSDTTPTLFADLRTNVHNFWDRGLLGMALDPAFPARPYVYVLYAYDAAIGGAAPRWGTAGVTSDGCPTPPGATGDGCVISSRLSRLTAAGNVMTGSELVLLNDWCQQFPSHSAGTLAFGPDGALYASAGEGAAFHTLDWGQLGGSSGSPVVANPCGDPPSAAGTALAPPSAEGGSLRSQDLRTAADPTSLDGTIIRIDPNTGAAAAGNPNTTGDANARRIIAHGMRNPFRFTFRPGTSEIWSGDVGDGRWEELNRIVSPTAGVINFGWPCYEGTPRHPSWDGVNVNICESLYTAGTATAPYLSYAHNAPHSFPGNTCPTATASVSGVAFYGTGSYPASYRNGLFMSDYSRKCVWFIPAGSNGLPDGTQGRTFLLDAGGPIDLEIGPGGDLFYLDYDNGLLRRVQFFGANQPPVAAITTDRTSGPAPLTVAFDGRGSSDADNDTLTYLWDLDGDGALDDGAGSTATFTYTAAGTYTARLRVTDPSGASGDQTVTISAGNTPPVPSIATPQAALRWSVADSIAFSGSARDAEQGNLGAGALTWSLVMHHCAADGSCHTHGVQDFAGVASGSFVAPDHEYPSYLELRLTATDGGGLSATTSVRLDPATVGLTLQSAPVGLSLGAGSSSGATPMTLTLIARSTVSVSAPPSQSSGGRTYAFVSWSDGGAATHTVTVADTQTLTATYRETASGPIASDAFGRTVASGWGTADIGGTWRLTGGSAPFAVGGGVGTMRVGTGQTRAADLAVSARDVDLSFSVSRDKPATGSGQYAYAVMRRIDAATEYRVQARIRSDGQVLLGAVRVGGGAETAVGAQTAVGGLTAPAGVRIRIRVQATGASPTTLRARAWRDGAAEPQTWTLQVTDAAAALQVAGGVGLRAYVSSSATNGPITFSFDDFVVTSTGTAPPPPPPPGTQLAADAFGRTLTGSWGVADLGGSWTIPSAPASFAVGSGTGTIVVGKGLARSAALAVNARDVDQTFTVWTDTAPSGSGQYAYAVTRRVDAANEYRALLRFTTGGVHVMVSSLLGGRETVIGGPVEVAAAGTFAPGQRWHLRMQVVGASPTTIRARAWRDGTAEPTTWNLSVTDATAALQAAGSVALMGYVSSSATSPQALFSFDDYSARPPS
jgi:glucose/arabinose dehydrogenase